MSLTPTLTATPGAPPTYNVGMAETFSWIPVEGAGRPLFARATYLTNASDITLSGANISMDLTSVESRLDTIVSLVADLTSKADAQLGQNGFDFIEPGYVAGNWTTVTVVSATKIAGLTATNTTIGNLPNYELPITFTFSGPIEAINLSYGSIIAYK
jgi:hypothetical protein